MPVFNLEKSLDPLPELQAKARVYTTKTRLDIKNKVETWYDEGKAWSWQRVMALVGPAGCGKSVIMACLAIEGRLVGDRIIVFMLSIPKRLPSQLKDPPALVVGAAHFFKHEDSNASSVRVCFLSIANQLAVAVPGVKEELLKLDQNEIESVTDVTVLFRKVICAPTTRVKAPEHPIVVLLDALDEANVDEREELVEILTTMWETEVPQWLGVIVSSRPDGVIERVENKHVLRLESEENVKDLDTFFKWKLERCMKPDVRSLTKWMIGKTMVKRCEGLFLYAGFVGKMMQQREKHSVTVEDMRILLNEFPPGLETVYREYFTRFLQGPLQNNVDQYQILLSSMVAARTPIYVEMVTSLLELENQDVEAFVARTQHLLIVEQGRIRFVHESMRDFLQDRKRAGRVADEKPIVGGKRLSVSIDLGVKQLLKVCKANPTSPFAREHLIYHLCKEKDWESVKDYLLDFDWVHAAVSMPGVAKRLIEDTDEFYNYESYSDIQVTDVIRAIELGREDIQRDPNALVYQLLGRINDRSHPILASLATSEFAKSDTVKDSFVPIRATFVSTRSPLRKILDGFSSPVNAVAVEGDTVVISCYEDRDVRLFNRRSGKCLHVLEGHLTWVHAVAIDGDTVVSGAESLRLWDRRSGKCLHVLKGHWCYFPSVAIDGNTVVSCSNNVVQLWDWRFGECVQVLKGHSREVNSVAIYGDTVVSGSLDKTVRLWDRRSGECLEVLEGHSSFVNTVAIDGDTVVSGSTDCTLRLWDRRSGKCLNVLEGHSHEIKSVAIDGDSVVSGSEDDTVRLWNRRSGECLQVLEEPYHNVNAVDIDEDVIVSSDWTVRVWDRRSCESLPMKNNSSFVCTVAFHGNTVVSGSHGETVRLWDRTSGECFNVLEGHSEKVESVAIDGDTVVSGSSDCTARVWDRRSGECLKMLEGHSSFVNTVAIAGDTVVSGSHDRTVRLWNRRSGKCLNILEGHSSQVTSVAIDGDTVVSGSSDCTVRLWDRRSGECFHVLEGHSRGVNVVVIDGDTVASGSNDDTVLLWDQRSGECFHVLEGHSSSVRAIAIDGDTVLSGSDDWTVRLWNRRSGECSMELVFDSRIVGVAVEKVEGSSWMVVSDVLSQIPHVLVPFFTQQFT